MTYYYEDIAFVGNVDNVSFSSTICGGHLSTGAARVKKCKLLAAALKKIKCSKNFGRRKQKVGMEMNQQLTSAH